MKRHQGMGKIIAVSALQPRQPSPGTSATEEASLVAGRRGGLWWSKAWPLAAARGRSVRTAGVATGHGCGSGTGGALQRWLAGEGEVRRAAVQTAAPVARSWEDR